VNNLLKGFDMKTHEMHDWLKAGAYYRGKGNFQKALEAFAQARLALLCEMGECLTSLGQLEEGRILFEEVLEANQADMRANAGMGIIYLLAGEHASAETAFGNVLHLEPTNAKALCGLGVAQKSAGRLQEAFDTLKQALEHDADQKTALQALAEVGNALGRTGEVLPRLNKYLKKHPEDAEIASDMKALVSVSPAPQTAPSSDAELLRNSVSAFKAAPDDPRTVAGLLSVLRRLGREKEALEVRAAFITRNPGKESALLQF
jgi:tetratricopeptide (TPR) repeat protein